MQHRVTIDVTAEDIGGAQEIKIEIAGVLIGVYAAHTRYADKAIESAMRGIGYGLRDVITKGMAREGCELVDS